MKCFTPRFFHGSVQEGRKGWPAARPASTVKPNAAASSAARPNGQRRGGAKNLRLTRFAAGFAFKSKALAAKQAGRLKNPSSMKIRCGANCFAPQRDFLRQS
ncbi:hypothetical protein [Bordetella trematum]|uniref:hypothetical protein n=1 Tax=Bordetella trematum TaxID=123899 RepID=UPI003989E80C